MKKLKLLISSMLLMSCILGGNATAKAENANKIKEQTMTKIELEQKYKDLKGKKI